MAGLTESEGQLERLLRSIEPLTPYADLLGSTSEGVQMRLDRQQRSVQPVTPLAGAVFRAWGNRGWIETASGSLADADLERAATTLSERLGHSGGAREPEGPSPTVRAESLSSPARSAAALGVEAGFELLGSWFAWAVAVPGVRNAITSMETRTDERLFRSTSGARCHQRLERVRGGVVALAIDTGRVEYDFFGRGGQGGLEQIEGITEARVARAGREAVALLKAGEPPSGRTKVLLDPSTAGTFAHESFGHGAEADQILRDRSYLAPLLGSVVGPPSLTLVDDGSLEGGWGSIAFDDEGEPSKRTVLVDKGRFAELLTDRASAARLGRRPSGNARRADVLSRSFVRMTNTFVAPGDRSLEELLRSVDDGVLLESCTSGVEDPLGGQMQIKVKKGHRIRHGELAEILPSMALSGRVLEVLRSIRGVSRAEEFEMSPGYCGKGNTDLLPTGTGGPYLLAEAIVGPG